MVSSYSELGLPRFKYLRPAILAASGVAIVACIAGAGYDRISGDHMEEAVIQDISDQLGEAAQVSVELTPFAFPVINEHEPTVTISGLGECAIKISTHQPSQNTPKLILSDSAEDPSGRWQIINLESTPAESISPDDLAAIIQEACPQPGATIQVSTDS